MHHLPTLGLILSLLCVHLIQADDKDSGASSSAITAVTIEIAPQKPTYNPKAVVMRHRFGNCRGTYNAQGNCRRGGRRSRQCNNSGQCGRLVYRRLDDIERELTRREDEEDRERLEAEIEAREQAEILKEGGDNVEKSKVKSINRIQIRFK